MLIFKAGKVEIWKFAEDEFFIYGVTLSGDPRVTASEGMAREVAAGGVA